MTGSWKMRLASLTILRWSPSDRFRIPPPEDTGFKLPALTVDKAVTSKLKDILMENIEKVKADKDYIPQAQAVKDNVDSILNLAKTEIEYLNALHRINRD